MDQAGLATLLVGREPEAIIRTLAMMSYNPAIGRVLEEGGVLRFADLMAASIPNIYTALIGRTFDTWHAEICDKILADFKTSRGEKLSYGQAQKPLNVFLKVYVDWAKLPSRELAEKHGCLLMLDIQMGYDTVQNDVLAIADFLKRPYVHLAIDPEFHVAKGKIPGESYGSLSAAEADSDRMVTSPIDSKRGRRAHGA